MQSLKQKVQNEKTEQEAYFNWHFVVSIHTSDSKIASNQDTNSKLTKANSELSQKLTKLEQTSKCSSDILLSAPSLPLLPAYPSLFTLHSLNYLFIMMSLKLH